MLKNGIWGRFFVVLAVAGLLAAQGSTIRAQGTDGGRHSQCVTTCNATRNVCNETCKTDCAGEFPDDKDARMTCETTCREFCFSSQKECRAVCEQIKNDPSPQEP